jgi:hypothetical protein
MIVFRSPFDLETIERLGEVRAALETLAWLTMGRGAVTPPN